MICGNEVAMSRLGWTRPRWGLPQYCQNVLILARESQHRIEDGKVYLCRAEYVDCGYDHKKHPGTVLELFEYNNPRRHTGCYIFRVLKYQGVPAWCLHPNLVHWWNADINADLPDIPGAM